MTRPPRPDIRPGDGIEVQICAWQTGKYGTRRWLPTGETFETVAGEVCYDRWIPGGWCVDLPPNPHHGRTAAQYVRVLDRAAWTEPDLFEAVG
jgi:hypothetical protein